MTKVLDRARQLYNSFQVGEYSYGEKRGKYDALLDESLKLLKPESKIFDIGCGKGYYLSLFANHGFAKENLFGLDLAPENVRELTAKGFRVVCGDALEINFESDSSDFTFSQGVIHHTSDPRRAFRELIRITKPQGLVYVNVYNKWNPYYYIAHRATWPIRMAYWNWSRKVFYFVFLPAWPFLQLAALVAMGEFLDWNTAKTIFMDQVMTPRACVFSKRDLERWASESGCEVLKLKYNRLFLMVGVLLRVKA